VKPAAPTKLTVSNITTTGFRLNWSESTDNVGVKGYKVFLNDSEVANHSKSQYYATGLNPGTTYDLRVSAYDQAGNESDFSVTKFVNTLPSAPPPPDTIQPSSPQNLVTTNVTMTSFRVNWSYSIDNVGIKEYEVYRNGVLMGTTPHLTFFFAGIVPNSTSLIRLVAVDHAGNKSSLSSVLAAKTLTGIALTEKVAPTTPGNVAANNETTSGFTLNWNKSTDNVYVLGYNIYLNGKYHASVSNGANSYTFSGLTASTNYNVQILAYDVAKNRSARTTTLSVQTK
jgi:chitodextrinase